MPRSTWSAQDAKNRFGAVIAAARRTPQTITRHGKPAVVVVDATEFARLSRLEKQKAISFAEHFLAMPTDDGEFEPLDGALRDSGL
jgi:prevent-host-death family protein